MHHHVGVVQCEQAIGLVAVREQCARHGAADDEADDGVAGQACGSVGVRRCSQREVDAVGFLATAVGLACHIDDGDDGALLFLRGICSHDIAHGARELPAFDEADFTVACAREAVLGIGHDGDVARGLACQHCIDDLQRAAVTRHRCADGERAHPGRAARGKFVLAHATSFA